MLVRHSNAIMDVYKTVVDAANLNGGLFSTLHELNEDDLNAVYDEILLREGDVTSEGAAAMRKERWTECTSKGKDVLPRLGHVACATAFEAFVHDAFKRCLETVFSTSKVSETDERFWVSWLQSRAKESVGWQQQEHESETRFWTEFEPTKDVQYDTTQPEKNTSKPCPTIIKKILAKRIQVSKGKCDVAKGGWISSGNGGHQETKYHAQS